MDYPKEYKEWHIKYIELKSDIFNERSDKDILADLNKSRVSLFNFKHKHPDFVRYIRDNMVAQSARLGIEGIRSVIRGTKKDVPQMTKMALNMDNLAIDKSEITQVERLSNKDLLDQLRGKAKKVTDEIKK